MHGPRPVAPGVWLVRGNPGRLNVYLIEDHKGGVTLFDAGGAMMRARLTSLLAGYGPLRRIVLGHAHTDHRGSAPLLAAPVVCHADEIVDAEGSGGMRYWGAGMPKLPFAPRMLHRLILQPLYDGGPVQVAGTVAEGDDVSGFRVVHLPGHSPGLIALIRDHDGIALTSDAFYTVDAWWRDSAPSLPSPAWNWNTDLARESLLRLAALELREAWPGHGGPVRGPVGALLRRAVERS